MDGAASQGDRAMQPNLNELLPGAKPWLTGGSSAPDADSESIRGISRLGFEAVRMMYDTDESKEGGASMREKRDPDFRAHMNLGD